MDTLLRYTHHLFFCTGNKCLGKGNEELKILAQTYVASQGLDREIMVTKSGCLDQCEYGPMVLVYPDGKWFSGMDEAGVRNLLDQIKDKRPLLPRHLHFQFDQKKG